jgi:hypothetical protein
MLLRLRRKLSRGSVVDSIVAALGLDPGKREKVDGYYHRLETGLLDPGGVNRRVWDAVGEFLHANVRMLAGLRPPSPAPEGAVFHRLELHERVSLAKWDTAEAAEAGPEPVPEREVRDEVDRLFTAGP